MYSLTKWASNEPQPYGINKSILKIVILWPENRLPSESRSCYTTNVHLLFTKYEREHNKCVFMNLSVLNTAMIFIYVTVLRMKTTKNEYATLGLFLSRNCQRKSLFRKFNNQTMFWKFDEIRAYVSIQLTGYIYNGPSDRFKWKTWA